MVVPYIKFQSINLNQPFKTPQRFDLAMSLEVAEHLEKDAAEGFVHSLTDAADVVLFSAAFPDQGGSNHINERPHSYWAKLFAQKGYIPFDMFRPYLWGESDVCFWYKQNAFLYVKDGSDFCLELHRRGLNEIIYLPFMDAIHPEMVPNLINSAKTSQEKKYKENLDLQLQGQSMVCFRSHLKDIIPSLYRAIRRRFIF
jgi:hypothetical protein